MAEHEWVIVISGDNSTEWVGDTVDLFATTCRVRADHLTLADGCLVFTRGDDIQQVWAPGSFQRVIRRE